MKLYKEVLIESAEQAEALPTFTVARYIDGDVRAAIKTVDGIWESVPGFYGEEANFSEDLVGWTALVPIEAEEETRVTPEALVAAAMQALARANRAAATGMLPTDRLTIQQQTRLVTPWRAQD